MPASEMTRETPDYLKGLRTCASCGGGGRYANSTDCGACEGTGREMPQELRLGVHLRRLGETKNALDVAGNVSYAGQLLINQFVDLKRLQARVAELEALNTDLLFN